MAESKLVLMAVPFNVITAPEIKPAPVAVSVKSGLPAANAEGEMAARLNEPVEPPVMVSDIVPDVVLSAFITRMFTEPALAICAALTFAVSWVGELTVVGSAVPFHRMVVPDAKFVPPAVSVNALPPACTVAGVMEESVGASTPLNPPQPPQKRARTNSNTKPWE